MDVAVELHHRVDALRRCFGVEAPEQFGAHMRHVVGPGNERVPAVPGDHDVARRVDDRDAVGGRVGLDVPAMRLRLEPRDQFVEIVDEAVEPPARRPRRRALRRDEDGGRDASHPKLLLGRVKKDGRCTA